MDKGRDESAKLMSSIKTDHCILETGGIAKSLEVDIDEGMRGNV